MILSNREIEQMSEKERKEKKKELKKELIKQNVAGEDNIRPKEIKKAIARILTFEGNPEKDKS